MRYLPRTLANQAETEDELISISKRKVDAYCLLTLMILLSVSTVHGFTFTKVLPSNTIYYDDFGGTSNGWITETTGVTTGTLAQLNSTLGFDSPNSFGLYEPNANAHIGIYKNFALPQGTTRIGLSAWFTFNYAMYVTVDGQAPELSLWWWSLNTLPNIIQFHHAMVEYRPAKGQFEAFTPDDGTPTQFYRFPGSDGTRDGYFAYNDVLRPTTSGNAWYWLKFVVDITSNKYVSYCSSAACFGNVTGDSIGNTAGAGTAPAGSIAGNPSSIIGVDIRETNDATQLNANALFDDVLITDETLGNPQFFAGFGGLGLAWVVVFLVAPLFYFIARHVKGSRADFEEMKETIRK